MDRVVDVWVDDFDLSEQSIRRMVEVTKRFVTFIENAGGVRATREISADHCERFVKALLASGSGSRSPAVATMHLRRATLRLLFRTARDLGIYEGDPTLDLVLPPRTSLKVRALTDEEVALCRSFSLHSLTETRLPAAWALAEATARTAEIPRIKGSDVDTEHGRVWLHGGSKAEPRWGRLTTWGLTQVMRRIEALGEKDRLLIPLHRLRAISGYEAVELLQALGRVRHFLRRIHRFGLGTILELIAELARAEVNEHFEDSILSVCRAIADLDGSGPVTVATLNYEGLLHAGFLELESRLEDLSLSDLAAGYDPVVEEPVPGFPLESQGIRQVDDLRTGDDIWLINLHGSLGWLADPETGQAWKFELDELRNLGGRSYWEHFMSGDARLVPPSGSD